jgi:hypothetical protein
MKQGALTILTPVDPAHVDDLEPMLAQLGANIAKQTLIPFDQLDLLHFTSWVIIQSVKFGPQLVFESNFDGTPQAFLDQLASRARAALDEIYKFCPGYPSSGDNHAVAAYLLQHAVYTDTFYVGCVGLTRQRINQDKRLREKIEIFLDNLSPIPTAKETRRLIQDFVRADPELQWALTTPETPSLWDKIVFWSPVAIAGLILVVLIVFIVHHHGLLIPIVMLALLVFAAYVVLRQHEISDPSISDEPNDLATQAPPTHVRYLVQQEDRRPQNHLASVTIVKPGLFRFTLLKIVLAAINILARFKYNKGQLGGIPSIHFARWAMINHGEQLLFLSNFDGSWEHYLGEFIDQAAGGLSAVWSNAVNFPRTTALVKGGAADEQMFKAYARRSQIPAQLWYSAYPFLSVPNILDNAAIRQSLWGDLSDSELEIWLRRF